MTDFTRIAPPTDWTSVRQPVEVTPWFDAPEIEIDRPTFAVGDIHGQAEALGRLLTAMADAAPHPQPLIGLGDANDRGPQTIDVLLNFMRPDPRFSEKVFLAGNHDIYLHEMMRQPGPATAALATSWQSDFGGAALLDELEAIRGSAQTPALLKTEIIEALAIRGDLRLDQADDLLDAYLAAPLGLVRGNVLFVHAGVDLDLERRDIPAFLDKSRAHIETWWKTEKHFPFLIRSANFQRQVRPPRSGLFVVHGHMMEHETYAKPVPMPSIDLHRIDTSIGRLGLDGCSVIDAPNAAVTGAELAPGRYRIFSAPLTVGVSLQDQLMQGASTSKVERRKQACT